DVILFVDTFGPRTLAAGVRAAHTLAEAYLTGRDRVGLITFGGTVAWVLPRRVLPPKALVVAVTPMEDQRVLSALVDMRARGIDVVTVEVSPVPYNPPGRSAVEKVAH